MKAGYSLVICWVSVLSIISIMDMNAGRINTGILIIFSLLFGWSLADLYEKAKKNDKPKKVLK